MENYEALLALSLLKKPIAEYFQVSNNLANMLNAHLVEPLTELFRAFAFFSSQ
jgi:hypothetical protein